MVGKPWVGKSHDPPKFLLGSLQTVSCAVLPSGPMFSLPVHVGILENYSQSLWLSPHHPQHYKFHREEQNLSPSRLSAHQGWGLQRCVPCSCCSQHSWLWLRPRTKALLVSMGLEGKSLCLEEQEQWAPGAPDSSREAATPHRPARLSNSLPHPTFAVP